MVADEDCEIILLNVKRLLITCPTCLLYTSIYVGILMLGGLKKVDFEDLSPVAPVALMLIAMPISGSIGHGIGLGPVSYTHLDVYKRQAGGR